MLGQHNPTVIATHIIWHDYRYIFLRGFELIKTHLENSPLNEQNEKRHICIQCKSQDLEKISKVTKRF